MRTITPLRYPGGKAALAPVLKAVVDASGLAMPAMAEPFAGGAGASLEMLFSEHVRSILINDLDYRIFSFWWSILNRTEEFARRINSVALTIREWKNQRAVYRNPWKHKRLDVGFAAFYLNRTNHSGILMNGGPIGGIKQTGRWGIDARFTRPALIDRIQRIAAYKERISVSNFDALVFLRRLESDFSKRPVFIYLDPPYYRKGSDLYLSTYTHEHHVEIASTLKSCSHKHWAVTYDDVRPIRKIYAQCSLRSFRLRYTANIRRQASELLILPKEFNIPRRLLQDTAGGRLTR